jgi:transcriptional regulator with XRE-family HTH domain
MESWTDYLRSLRERAGLSQIEVSLKAGLHETYYGKIEAYGKVGGRRPSIDALIQILAHLACSAEEQQHALRLFALSRFPLAFVDGLAARPQSGTAGAVVPSPKRPRASTRRRRTTLGLLLVGAASGAALVQPQGVEAARLISAAPIRGILSHRPRRRDEAA